MIYQDEARYPHIGRMEEEIDTAFWEDFYRIGDTGWDQGAASPGLVDFLRNRRIEPGSILVPGCGRGHDARALAGAGFDVTGIDITEGTVCEAVSLAEEEQLQKIRFVRADFFNLPETLLGPYDWVFEHTFFCAFDPRLRKAYVEKVAALLKPGGNLIGIFYNIQPETGPPFGCTREELIERFTTRFRLIFNRIPRSFPDRNEEELLMHWQRR